MPNRNLYLWILLASVAISGFALLLPGESPWFTILTGLGCGGTASAIVAGLVEYSNWQAEKRKKTEVRASCLHDFYEAFEDGIFGFARLCYMLQAVQDRDRKMTWHDWCCLAYDSLDDNTDHIQLFIDSYELFLDCIAEEALKIEDQKADMLTENILGPSDIEAITMILSFQNFSGTVFGRTQGRLLEVCAQERKFYSDVMHEYLGKAEVLQAANEMPVGARLYKALEMMGDVIQ